jgi:hypothetical protein
MCTPMERSMFVLLAVHADVIRRAVELVMAM